MRYAKSIIFCLSLTPLGSCGLYVPKYQENPLDKVGDQQLIQSIVYNVTCELQDSIDDVYNNPDNVRKSTFLDSWGANISLNLQIDEKSSVNPVATWLPPSPATAVFTLAGGGTISADANRQDKLNSFFTVKELRALGPCTPNTRPGGVLLMQTDLGLKEWLRANVIASDRHLINFANDYTDSVNKTNVLSHEIKFDITNTENINPAFKLTRVLINQSGNLLSATRDRTNDLIITFGPTVPTPHPAVDGNGKPLRDRKGRSLVSFSFSLSDAAAQSAFASQIGQAVSGSLKGP